MRKRKDGKTAAGSTFEVDFKFDPPNWKAAPQAAPGADQPGTPATATGRNPRITRLMALAIKLQDMVATAARSATTPTWPASGTSAGPESHRS
jgi:hypothetical protein